MRTAEILRIPIRHCGIRCRDTPSPLPLFCPAGFPTGPSTSRFAYRPARPGSRLPQQGGTAVLQASPGGFPFCVPAATSATGPNGSDTLKVEGAHSDLSVDRRVDRMPTGRPTPRFSVTRQGRTRTPNDMGASVPVTRRCPQGGWRRAWADRWQDGRGGRSCARWFGPAACRSPAILRRPAGRRWLTNATGGATGQHSASGGDRKRYRISAAMPSAVRPAAPRRRINGSSSASGGTAHRGTRCPARLSR